MREKGPTLLAIVKYLYENSYKSARAKSLKNSHIYSILKKWNSRNNDEYV